MAKLQPTDIIRFGKNYGLTLAEVYQFQPSYIEWAILEIDDFQIDMEKFENLPAPTTIGYNGKRFENKISDPSASLVKEVDGKSVVNIEHLKELMEATDMFNPVLSVVQVKEMIEEGHSFDLLDGFRFPEKVRVANNAKKR